MQAAYFDTTVYDHIAKGYIPGEEVEALRAVVTRGAVVLELSVVDVEELIEQWDTERAAAVERLVLARELAGFDSLLKPSDVLLQEAIHAFATGSPTPAPTLPRRDRRFYARQLDRAAAGNRELAPELSQIVGEVRARKRDVPGIDAAGTGTDVGRAEKRGARQYVALEFGFPASPVMLVAHGWLP